MELQALLQVTRPLRYLCQDETRLGRKTETKRVITRRGVKPKATVQWPREAFWLYGVVEPDSGWGLTQAYDKLNHQCFQAFLEALSQELEDDIAILQLDGAPAHRAKNLDWPENLIPLFQPAHSPEVNPIERLWQALKGRWKGENFPSLAALRQRFSDELQQMTPEAIQSLTGDDFILETLLAANFQLSQLDLMHA
jgi:transposase